ncbi:MAG: TetR/AcrR family transcriptional regulator [Myxococcota bacterium]|nr:TetR/AcrR family transcriptional regulator [Myxococcota bacterium]
MARPPQANPAETRRRILDAGSRLFATAGVDGCSVRELARDVGVSVATIHHHFGSKDGLHEACLQSMYDDLAGLEGVLLGLFEEQRPDVLEQVIRHSWRFARSHQLQLRLLMRSVVSVGGLDEGRRKAHMLPFLEMGSQALGSVAGVDPQQMRLVLQSGTNLLVRYALGNPTEVHALTGLRGAKGEKAIEDHLVWAILALVDAKGAA